MNEHSYVRSIHRHLPDDVFVWKICDKFAGGVPDAWYHGPDGKIIFVEYKYVATFPSRASTRIKPKLSSLQINWLTQRQAAGINVALVIGSTYGGLLIEDDFETVPEKGLPRSAFLDHGLAPKEIANAISQKLNVNYQE
jgi:hypothetical protein